MANPLNKLSDAFKTSQGQIASGSTEELAAQQGQLSVPKDPASALALGATDQQAAMSGSRASLRSTIRQNMDLGVQQRQGAGVPQDAAAAAKAKQDAAGLTQSMGALDTRVQELVQSKVGNPQAAKEAALKVSNTAMDAVPQQNRAALEPLLGKLGAGTATPSDLLQINTLMGKTTQADMLDAETLKKQFMQGEEQIGQALAAGMGNALKVSELNIDSLGMGSKADIANKLGVSVADVDNLTATEFMGKMHDFQQRELTRTQSLQQRANDPMLGQAERQQARQELRGAGATGLRSAEESVADIQDQINTANTVSFGGQNLSVEKLMGDENMSAMVASYLRDPASDSSKALASTEPGLVDWIKSNKAGLDTLTAGVSTQAQQFADIQTQTKKLATPEGMIPLNEDTMKALMPDWGKLTDKVPQTPAILQMMHDPKGSPEEKQALNMAVTKLATTPGLGPEYVAELRDMSAQNLRALGLTQPGAADKYAAYVLESSKLDSVQPDARSVMSALGLDSESANAKLQELRQMEALGVAGSGSQLANVLDPDGDGRVNAGDMGRIKEELKGLMGGNTKSLTQLLQSGQRVDGMPTIGSLTGSLSSRITDTEHGAFFKSVSSSLADRNFSAADAEQAVRNGLNDSAQKDTRFMSSVLNKMGNLFQKGLAGGDGLDRMKQLGRDAAQKGVEEDFAKDPAIGASMTDFGHMMNRIGRGDVISDVEEGRMRNALTYLQNRTVSPDDTVFAKYKEEEVRAFQRNLAMQKTNKGADTEGIMESYGTEQQDAAAGEAERARLRQIISDRRR